MLNRKFVSYVNTEKFAQRSDAMTETNIRIVETGTELVLITRCPNIIVNNLSPEKLERVCNQFASQGLAAVNCPQRKQILVLTSNPITPFVVKDDKKEWIIEVEDGKENLRLQFSHSENDALLLAQLIERHVRIQIKRRLKMHTIDSTRIFQDLAPSKTSEGINVYRRIEVSALPIQGVGVGISADISTAFFTQMTVADFFRNDISNDKQRLLRNKFDFLRQRQIGQKGTLLYDIKSRQTKCYFVEFRSDVTCGETQKQIIEGKVYDSLLHYYQQKQPQLDIDPKDSVAMVSFPNLDGSKPVAAKLLRLRVMNESLPRSLKQVDKIQPKDRVKLINDFWLRFGMDLLGKGKPQISRKFWKPNERKTLKLLPPALQFADGAVLQASEKRNKTEFQEHYRQRLNLLNKYGCLNVPSSIERTVHFAVPTKLRQEVRGNLIKDLTEYLKRLTNKGIIPKVLKYETLDEAFSILKRQNNPGMVVFVFDDESTETYYKVAYQLQNWRVKRITSRQLKNKYSNLNSISKDRNVEHYKPKKGWKSFIEMIALDVLQQMNCIPWGFKDVLPYDAHLAIDVGRNKRYFALSLIIFHPSIHIYTIAKAKYDSKKETINSVVLFEEIMEMCSKVLQRGDFQSLHSLLILRDGRECDGEIDAIYKAKEELIRQKFFAEGAKVDVVDFHKSIAKNLRTWERTKDNAVFQILEGEAVPLDNNTVVLNTTGEPTRYQGTADPVLLVGRSRNINMDQVVKAVYASTHLNYSNPNVAQRLPLELKRTDDELINRASQEIRGLK